MSKTCKTCVYMRPLGDNKNVCQYNPPTVMMAPIRSTQKTEHVPSDLVTGKLTKEVTITEYDNQVMSSYPPVMETHSCSYHTSKEDV